MSETILLKGATNLYFKKIFISLCAYSYASALGFLLDVSILGDIYSFKMRYRCASANDNGGCFVYLHSMESSVFGSDSSSSKAFGIIWGFMSGI